ncbi:MAG: hypothetical protein PHE89_05980 [Alphaproteobacteria bacterium]|nr:hypothetical protein [Alphaproteobacteria bacterium]
MMKNFLSVIYVLSFCLINEANAQNAKVITMPAETPMDEIDKAYLEEVTQQKNLPVLQKKEDEVKDVKKEVAEENKISKDTSLTDMIDEKSGVKEQQNRETWLDEVRENARNEIISAKEGKTLKNTLETDATSEESAPKKVSLKGMLEESKKSIRRSNASIFDISGAMLRMTPKQIDDVLSRRGYRKTREKFEIPNFIKWRKEDDCRAKGVVGYEKLASCVVQESKKDNYQYLETVSYSKFDSKESITIRFTSNFTNNKSYKISYTSDASDIKGNTQKAIYIRNIKIYDFWKQINQKYGVPDNKDEAIWGLGGNKPYMQAKTGKLMLEDPMLRELDYTRMSREDQRFINTGTYNF